MHVLVLHSAVTADAPPEELDTLISAHAIGKTLQASGHYVRLASFSPDSGGVRAEIARTQADVVFNVVESVFGEDSLAAMAPAILDGIGIPYTGSGAAPLGLAGDKPLAKRVMRKAGLPTPDWSEPPSWNGVYERATWFVKSATQDASLGLDSRSAVEGREQVISRAELCARRFGGRWFAERYVEGREFNVALIEEGTKLEPLPIPEMCFVDWPHGKPRIVGYSAKWESASPESTKTVRAFGVERDEPALAESLSSLAVEACRLMGVRGYARVDFRIDPRSGPTILEVNPNPCLAADAGFAAAALESGTSYARMIEKIVAAALKK